MNKAKLFTVAICAATILSTDRVSAGPEPLPSGGKDKAVVPIAPAPAEPCDWTGFYIGGNLGAAWHDYDFGRYDVSVDQPQILFPPVTFSIPSHEFDREAELIGGGQIGFNKQWGHFLMGVEGDFQGTDISRSSTFVPDTISHAPSLLYTAIVITVSA